MITFRRIPKRLAAALAGVLLVTAFSAYAEETPENYVPYPHGFIGIQGGGQVTFTNYNNWQLVTPTASIYAGIHFTPVLGARLHINGLWNKGGYQDDAVDFKYKYKYLTTNVDMLVNLVTLLGGKDYRPVNLYLLGGVGLNTAWDNGAAYAHKQELPKAYRYTRLGYNFRIGTMLDVRVAPNWSVNLEVSANSLDDRYNSKQSNSGDWQLTAQMGFAYKFGKARRSKASHEEKVAVESPNVKDTDNEAAPADLKKDIPREEKKPVVVAPPVVPDKPEPKEIRQEIFFTLRGTDVSPAERPKLEQVAEWLKKCPNAKAVVTGYADKETGTPAINARYASRRANSVKEELVAKYGIAASRITTDSKGDTVQPFTENDKNRVSVIVATGSEDVNGKTR